MSNPIKYTTGAAGSPTPFLIRGNFWIGLDPTYYYGPSGTTNFWGSYTTPQSGYAIHANKASNGPAIYAPTSDSALIATAKRLGASPSITTAGQALDYFYNNSSTYLCLNRSYYNIVWNGLKSFYDFGFSPSYPRAGKSAGDLAPARLSGAAAFQGDVTFTSSLGGYINLNGINQYVKFDTSITPGSNANWTVCVVMKATSFDAGFGTLFSNDSGTPVTTAFGTYLGKMSYDVYRSSWNKYTGATSLNAGKWYYLTWVHTSAGNLKMYVNNRLDFDGTVEQPSNGGPMNSLGNSAGNYFSGSISKFMYYDRALSYEEVMQNNNLGMAPLPYDANGDAVLFGGSPTYSYNAANETSGHVSASTLRNLTSNGGMGATADFSLNPLVLSGTVAQVSSDWGGVTEIQSGYAYISNTYIFTGSRAVISFWMRYNGTVNVAEFLGYRNATYTFYRGNILAGGTFQFTVWNSANTDSRSCTTTVNVCDGKWHHVCLIHSAIPWIDIPVAGIFIFVDGVQDASNTTSPLVFTSFGTDSFNIGGTSTSGHSCYFGPINLYTDVVYTSVGTGPWRDYYYHVNRFRPDI